MSDTMAEANIPLNYRDSEALDQMFDKIEIEEISQIEAITTRFSVIPLEPWEEKGWIVNSSFAVRKSTF